MVAPVPVPPYADPTSVIGRRVGAAVLDAAVVFGPAVAIEWSRIEYLDVADTRFDSGLDYCDAYTDDIGGVCVDFGDTVYFADDSGSSSTLLFLGLAIAMLVLLQGLTGFTLGKRLFGIRCVRPDGRAPGIGRAAARWVLLLIDGLPCIPLVGFITSLTTVGHRRVGDMAANTYVVRADAAGAPITVPGPAPAAPMPGPGGWAPPTTGVPAPPTQAPHFPTPTAKEGPQWDEARGTYIQWDPAASAWVQWDDTAKQWVPIR